MKTNKFLFFASLLLSSLSGFSQVNLDSSLVAKYYFNGNANDESVWSNHGTVTGAVLTTDRFGNANSAYSFDGNAFIEIEDNSPFDLQYEFTISIWVNQNGTTTSGYRLIDKITAGENDGYGFDTYGEGEGNRMRLMGYNNAIANTTYNLDVWNHLLVTVKDGTAKFYLNGILDGEEPFDHAPLNNLSILIGAAHYSPFNNNFIGKLDDIRIYKRALNEQEIQLLFTENTVNIMNVNNSRLSIYPNPANEVITIDGLQSGTIQIINMHGQVIKKVDISNLKTTIDISKFNPGIYILTLHSEKYFIMKRFIIK
ncbi:MAG TPA: LamG-like jellyroll fold domain-containing protein [Edaphocola sp.]|nr:LamG-like jellyroll fold domain-containing protein [Edaphocola sp.]